MHMLRYTRTCRNGRLLTHSLWHYAHNHTRAHMHTQRCDSRIVPTNVSPSSTAGYMEVAGGNQSFTQLNTPPGSTDPRPTTTRVLRRGKGRALPPPGNECNLFHRDDNVKYSVQQTLGLAPLSHAPSSHMILLPHYMLTCRLCASAPTMADNRTTLAIARLSCTFLPRCCLTCRVRASTPAMASQIDGLP